MCGATKFKCFIIRVPGGVELEENFTGSARVNTPAHEWGKRIIVGQVHKLLGLLFAYIKADIVTRLLVFAFRWVVVLMLFYATFSTIYRYGSSTHRKIPFFNPGALLATLLSVLLSWGFSFYVDNFWQLQQTLRLHRHPHRADGLDTA